MQKELQCADKKLTDANKMLNLSHVKLKCNQSYEIFYIPIPKMNVNEWSKLEILKFQQ